MYNMQPFITFVNKYLQKRWSFYLLLLRKLSYHCAHSKNTTSFNVSSTLFSTPFVTWKTSFYMDNNNINTHDSCIFDKLITNVCPVCTSDVLQTRTENFEQPKNNSIASESAEMSHVFWSMYTQRYSFFSSDVLHQIWRIFPRSFDIVIISDVPTRWLIFCTKQTRKQSLFLLTTSGMSRDLSWVPPFFRPHGVSLFGNTERCVVVFFSGLT